MSTPAGPPAGPATAPRAPELATVTSDDLVTGEAVALDLPPAGLGARIASGTIDLVVALVLLLVALFVFTLAALQTDEALLTVASIGTLVSVLLVFPTTMETLTRGRTLGKLALGLRTVRDDAGPISFQHAFTRSLIGVVELYVLLGTPAFFTALVNGRGKRLGDLAAGTYVVRDRFRLSLPAPPAMPPPLAGWARAADVSALPTGLALAVRQYLGRLATMDPVSRTRVGDALWAQVAPYVAPPPPADAPPAAVLAAVVATRRERDQARLGRERAFRERLTRQRAV
ncbi:hypothetical protein ENKNEFLB_01024 [Nocardioides aquaticus]|uniref:RDD domain-containing protein n=2 Tax=Nocardioides aquaticus TaxID=160826 RepID=A0ABX8EG96_9ACTN|nr:RDD family protein [Nocardioides aquaticus]QVT78646.1 hypothetical protein ENKNEFLB_01024 [Nocardioides aquaticus]